LDIFLEEEGRSILNFSWFRSFKALVENQTRKKIKILRTNNVTEYESNGFNNYCREAGIKRETTTAYTLEQNGVAKKEEPFYRRSHLCHAS